MAFADPQNVVLNAVGQSLARTASGIDVGAFTKADTSLKLSFSHAYNKRNRRVARLDHWKNAPDPLQPAINTRYNMSAYLVVDAPPQGYTLTEAWQVVDALTAWLTTGGGANVTKLLSGES